MARSLQQVALSVKRLQAHHHRELDAAMTPLGLTLVQWDALRHLDQHPDASLHELAQLTFQSDQAFGTLSMRMAERGLVDRVAGPRKSVRLVMTDRGRAALKAGAGRADEVLSGSLGTLSARQLEQLGTLLDRMLDRG